MSLYKLEVIGDEGNLPVGNLSVGREMEYIYDKPPNRRPPRYLFERRLQASKSSMIQLSSACFRSMLSVAICPPCTWRAPNQLRCQSGSSLGAVAFGAAFLLRLCYNAWFVGKIAEVNQRRTTIRERLCRIQLAWGGCHTRGVFISDADSYGPDRLWVLVEIKPIDVDSGSSSSPPRDSDDDD